MKVKVEFEIDLPEIEHTKEQLEEFLRFNLNDNGRMEAGNPFDRKADCDPIFGTFVWEYTD